MTEENVVPIWSGIEVPADGKLGKPNEDIIWALRRLLEEAESGNLFAFACVSAFKCGVISTWIEGQKSVRLVGAVAVLQSRLIAKLGKYGGDDGSPCA